MVTNPGEIWLADLGLAAKTRPVLIISRRDTDPPRDLVIYAPLTTQNRGSRYEVELPKLRFLTKDSTVNIQGIGSISTVRLERKLGEIPEATLQESKRVIVFALNLDQRCQVSSWLTRSWGANYSGLAGGVVWHSLPTGNYSAR
jgi:mRNA interferase MazF